MCVDSWIWKFETEEGARIADVRGDMASIAQSWRQGNLQEMQLRVSMSIRFLICLQTNPFHFDKLIFIGRFFFGIIQ